MIVILHGEKVFDDILPGKFIHQVIHPFHLKSQNLFVVLHSLEVSKVLLIFGFSKDLHDFFQILGIRHSFQSCTGQEPFFKNLDSDHSLGKIHSVHEIPPIP